MGRNVLPVLFTALLLLSGCGRKTNEKENYKTVKVVKAARYGEKNTEVFPGKVKSSLEIRLSFRQSGPIERLLVDDGQFVRKGEILAEMDPRDYKLQLEAVKADYEQVKAEVGRLKNLHKKKSLSDNDYDKAVSGLEQMTAKYDAAKNALSDTKLRAPFDGYIQKKLHKEGEIVSAGMPVFTIVSMENPEVEINIPSNVYIRKKEFASFSCRFNIYPGMEFPLKLESVNKKANLNQLYTMRLRIKEGKGTFASSPGMITMVSINFNNTGKNYVSVPYSAVFEKGGDSFVWVYDSEIKKVHARKVEILKINNTESVVISAGLKEGEEVVSS
jgi:RND family efflux transporter MFP subunit